jgi:hypothetical protein
VIAHVKDDLSTKHTGDESSALTAHTRRRVLKPYGKRRFETAEHQGMGSLRGRFERLRCRNYGAPDRSTQAGHEVR